MRRAFGLGHHHAVQTRTNDGLQVRPAPRGIHTVDAHEPEAHAWCLQGSHNVFTGGRFFIDGYRILEVENGDISAALENLGGTPFVVARGEQKTTGFHVVHEPAPSAPDCQPRRNWME